MALSEREIDDLDLIFSNINHVRLEWQQNREKNTHIWKWFGGTSWDNKTIISTVTSLMTSDVAVGVRPVLPVMYRAFSLAGLMPVVLVAVTHSSYWALGIRSVTVQWVSFTLMLLTENGEQIFICGCTEQNMLPVSFREIRKTPTSIAKYFNSRWG